MPAIAVHRLQGPDGHGEIVMLQMADRSSSGRWATLASMANVNSGTEHRPGKLGIRDHADGQTLWMCARFLIDKPGQAFVRLTPRLMTEQAVWHGRWEKGIGEYLINHKTQTIWLDDLLAGRGFLAVTRVVNTDGATQ